MKSKELVSKLENYNKSYRTGESIISDKEYDLLVEELEQIEPNHPYLLKIGHNISDKSRKRKLPIEMASMNKVKSVDEIFDWLRLKKIDNNTEFVITPKYDGLSFCVNELTNEAWTRGDGINGQKSDTHYKFIGNKHKSPNRPEYSYGEVMIPKQTFIDKYSVDFANPRNLMAGLINAKEISEILKDSVYIKYGIVDSSRTEYTTKSLILDYLNDYQEIKVPYEIINFNDLNEISINDYLVSLFYKWSKDFEIDGLVIEVNNISLQEKLGRETSSRNPVFSRAFKSPDFEQSAESEVINMSWNVSKQGLLKPVAQVNPINVGGVTITNCTLNNAKFVKDNDLGIGSRVLITRSGGVIPKIIKVIFATGFEMPIIDGVEIGWNENEIELITLQTTDKQEIKKIISFFEILESDNIGEGVVSQLWDAGYKNIKDILNLKMSDLEKINGFGVRKSEIVYNSIKKSITDVQLSKLQHASGIFAGLGSKKLVLLEHFTSKPTIEEIMEIEGFAEKSALSYIDGWDKFQNFIKFLPITIKKKENIVKKSNDLEGNVYVFTGIRRPDLVEIIESRGGRSGSSVSRKTTHLVMKEKGTGTAKEIKSIELGIKIITVEELESFLIV